MAWRYCTFCGNPQDKITFEDLEKTGFGGFPICCEHCGNAREDSTPETMIGVLIEEISELKKKAATNG